MLPADSVPQENGTLASPASGAELNAKEDSGATPLDQALADRHDDVAAILRAHGGRADLPIHDAAYAGDIATLRSLLAGRPDLVDMKDGDGHTPLRSAVPAGEKKAVELLISFGADVNTEDKQGATALDDAKLLQYTAIAEILRQHGAKANLF